MLVFRKRKRDQVRYLFLLSRNEKIIRRVGLDDGIGRAVRDGIFGKEKKTRGKRMGIKG
jgi:hypothetical protein